MWGEGVMNGCETDQTAECRSSPMKMRVMGEIMANTTLARNEVPMVCVSRR